MIRVSTHPHARFASLFIAVLVSTLLLLSAPARAAERKPNVIFIMADDLGYAELGCYGQKWIKTPHIDRIAAEGIRFTQFYSGSPVCAPARCNLMTGKHGGHAYIRNNGDPKHLQHLAGKYGWEFPGQNPIPDDEVTLAELLKAQGYATGAMGKWGLGHFGTTGDPTKQGFDLFFGFNCQRHAHNHYPRFLWRATSEGAKKIRYEGNGRTLDGKTHSQDEFIREALAFIRANKDKPFFLYLPFAIPHLSIQTTDKWVEKYKGVIPEEEYQHRGYLKHPFPRAGYAGMVSQMDHGVGQVMKLIDELGLDDDTVILFTSDNGPTYDRLGGSDSEFFGSAGEFRGLKGSIYEGGIRVPLVARWPSKIKPGTVSDLPSYFPDVLPTVMDLVGAAEATPRDIDGLSLAPTLLGKAGEQKKHSFMVWEFAGYSGQQAVRMGDWKGVRRNIHKGNTKWELYHLKIDVGEQTNVAAEHPEIVEKIDQIMRGQREPSELFPLKALDG